MTEQQQNGADQQAQFAIQRIYIKDLSFESPKSPSVFREEWKPNIELAIKTQSSVLTQDIHEVVLRITVTAKLANEVAFIIEVHQAGIFTIRNFSEQQLRHMLGSYCPTVLFPYAREAVSDLSLRGNFPPFALAPVDFDALYAQQLQKQPMASET